MIIANLHDNGICKTIYNSGLKIVELHDNAVEVPDWDEAYLLSYYDRETKTWIMNPSTFEYLWNEELKEFYLPVPPTEEAPTEE